MSVLELNQNLEACITIQAQALYFFLFATFSMLFKFSAKHQHPSINTAFNVSKREVKITYEHPSNTLMETTHAAATVKGGLEDVMNICVNI